MSRSKAPRVENTNCIYCNCRSHVAVNCNSNMKGRRKLLIDIGNTFMLDDNVLDFKSFPINELRFIACVYEKFQKTSLQRKMKHMYHYFECKCMVEYLHTPIPVTLTKSRLVCELMRRWNLYARVRINHNHTKPEDKDCPICMDCMSTPYWDSFKLKWELLATPRPQCKLFDGNIQTTCGHTFCSSCWEMHLNANSKVEYKENTWHDEPTGRMIVACPMCRHKMYYVK